MSNQLYNLLVLGGVFLALFLLCEWLFHRRLWDVEHTRKVAHAGAGLMALSFPLVFTELWQVLVLCGLFLLILVVTKYTGLLRSIHAITRVSYGSTMFPLVVVICFWRYTQTQNLVHFYLPVLVMALADPAACLVGKKLPIRKLYLNKSLGGAIAFFVVAFSLAIGMFYAFKYDTFSGGLVSRAALVGAVSTLAEAFSGRGFDNLTIPVATLAVI